MAGQLELAQQALGAAPAPVTVAQLHAQLLEYEWREEGGELLLDVCRAAAAAAAAAAPALGAAAQST